jgi:hypothetical protein
MRELLPTAAVICMKFEPACDWRGYCSCRQQSGHSAECVSGRADDRRLPQRLYENCHIGGVQR